MIPRLNLTSSATAAQKNKMPMLSQGQASARLAITNVIAMIAASTGSGAPSNVNMLATQKVPRYRQMVVQWPASSESFHNAYAVSNAVPQAKANTAQGSASGNV